MLRSLPRLLSRRTADFTVFVACSADDETAEAIDWAAALDNRIVPVLAQSSDLEDLERALIAELERAEEERARLVTDAMFVPLPLLEIKT